MPRGVGTGTNGCFGSLCITTLSFDIEGMGCSLWVGQPGEW